mgnify:CR=1 FL=1
MTVLVLVWLEETKKAQKMTWKLLGMKNKTWLRKQKVDLGQAKQDARAQIK